MKSLREWKENFVKAQKRNAAHERRAMAAEREMRNREDEMLAWAKAQVARREMIVSGMY